MHFWLIVFLFTAEGEYIEKKVYETANEAHCVEVAGDLIKSTQINTGLMYQAYCVSDDHYKGIAKDKDIDYN